MVLTRFFFKSTEEVCGHVFSSMDEICETYQLPISLVALNEQNNLHEFSIYMEKDDQKLQNEIEEFLLCQRAGIKIEKEILPDIDWVKKNFEDLPPIHLKRFFIHGSHNRAKSPLTNLTIEINAGLAFGTGHHPTTAGCLEMIDNILRNTKPQNALDLGTGSAILAIALAKMQRIPVLATDSDITAIKTALCNIRSNSVHPFVKIFCAKGFQHRAFSQYGPFDLIVANMIAQPLISLAPKVSRFLSPGGSLILSGIITPLKRVVISAYLLQKFRYISSIDGKEWVTLHLKH